MLIVISVALTVPALVVVVLWLFRRMDARTDRLAWEWLLRRGDPNPGHFDPESVNDLPEPAQRYFRYTISSGAPLWTVAQIEMTGELGLGTKATPNYRVMRAKQILAPPFGLVWRLKAGAISGSDGILRETSWTRFWLFNLLPVVRVAGTNDHLRSAFGRVVAEAAIWVPASLLPSDRVTWDCVNDDTARAMVRSAGQSQAVEITVAASGQPIQIVIRRWSNANPQKQFRWQSFGGTLGAFREFDGYFLPTRVEGGNLIGTKDYFPFYRARVSNISLAGQMATPR